MTLPRQRADQGFAGRQGFGGHHGEVFAGHGVHQRVQVVRRQRLDRVQVAAPHLVFVEQLEGAVDGARVERVDRADPHFAAIRQAQHVGPLGAAGRSAGRGAGGSGGHGGKHPSKALQACSIPWPFRSWGRAASIVTHR